MEIKGESMICLTTIDSLIDFVQKTLSDKWNAYLYSNNTLAFNNSDKIILTGIEEIKNCEQKIITCHQSFSNPDESGFYMCHTNSNTKSFKVTVSNLDGTIRTQLLGMCHFDTITWNSQNIAFAELNLKQGDPICHFMPYYDLTFCATESF